MTRKKSTKKAGVTENVTVQESTPDNNEQQTDATVSDSQQDGAVPTEGGDAKPDEEEHQDTSTDDNQDDPVASAEGVDVKPDEQNDQGSPSEDKSVGDDDNQATETVDRTNKSYETRATIGKSRWRGGVQHTEKPKTWPPGKFTEAQLTKIEADDGVSIKEINS